MDEALVLDIMVDRGVYTLRGWLAFVAFLDFAQAVRSWLDKDVFLGSYYFLPQNSSSYATDNVKRNYQYKIKLFGCN